MFVSQHLASRRLYTDFPNFGLAYISLSLHCFFFVPWPVWRDMKEAFGHMSVSAAELEDFRVRFTGAVLFLDYAHKIGGRWITGADCEIERWRRSK